jgi:flagellin
LGAHYSTIARSVERLSSGLRVNKSADDAAGLSIRELMRENIASLYQGIRNANDAVSMIQTADGALAVIDEKLIRMKELAMQAATGTYTAEQREMIDNEFQAMADEINRIAAATDFNGIKLLDGSLAGDHDGSGLTSTGELKVHFGTDNDSAEDYYYLTMSDASTRGLGLVGGLGGPIWGGVEPLSDRLKSVQQPADIDDYRELTFITSGAGEGFETDTLVSIIPKGTKGLLIHINLLGTTINDSLELFTRDGTHLAGTSLSYTDDWDGGGMFGGTTSSIADMNTFVLTEANGFSARATYNTTYLNGSADPAHTANLDANGNITTYTTNVGAANTFTYNGMTIGYSGDSTLDPGNLTFPFPTLPLSNEYLYIDEAKEDLILLIVGGSLVGMAGFWNSMPSRSASGGGSGTTDMVGGDQAISIKRQEWAQEALDKIDEAVRRKDDMRAYLGAMQHRLENTISNLQIQAENIQAAESRISDVDVAAEMTEFTRGMILAEASVAMLAQANSMPRIALSLING